LSQGWNNLAWARNGSTLVSGALENKSLCADAVGYCLSWLWLIASSGGSSSIGLGVKTSGGDWSSGDSLSSASSGHDVNRLGGDYSAARVSEVGIAAVVTSVLESSSIAGVSTWLLWAGVVRGLVGSSILDVSCSSNDSIGSGILASVACSCSIATDDDWVRVSVHFLIDFCRIIFLRF
jgi:hypothetical protein